MLNTSSNITLVSRRVKPQHILKLFDHLHAADLQSPFGALAALGNMSLYGFDGVSGGDG